MSKAGNIDESLTLLISFERCFGARWVSRMMNSEPYGDVHSDSEATSIVLIIWQANNHTYQQ